MHVIANAYCSHSAGHSFRVLLCEQCRSCCCTRYVYMYCMFEENSRDTDLHDLAHLRHGIDRVVILDIDLHHGAPWRIHLAPVMYSHLSWVREWDTIDCLANQRRIVPQGFGAGSRRTSRETWLASVLRQHPRRPLLSMRGTCNISRPASLRIISISRRMAR